MLWYMHDDFINNLLNSGVLQELQEKKRKREKEKSREKPKEKSRRSAIVKLK